MRAVGNPKIYFWGEGGDNKGMGHIVRLLSVAKHLKELAVSQIFVLLKEDDGAAQFIEKSNYEVDLFSDKKELFNQIQKGDIIVLDGYSFNNDDLSNIKGNGGLIVYIDDMQHLDLSDADIVINHTPGYKRSDFRISDDSTLFLGPEYCMLRPQFIENQERRQIGKLSNMVVSLGMSNSGDILNQLVGMLNQVFPDVIKYILPGANKLNKDVLNANNKVLELLDASALSVLFRSCDLAVMPLSTLYLESLASGLVVIGGYFVENQKVVYQKLIDKDVIWGLGDFNALNISTLIEIKLQIETSLPITTTPEFGSGWPKVKCKIKEWL